MREAKSETNTGQAKISKETHELPVCSELNQYDELVSNGSKVYHPLSQNHVFRKPYAWTPNTHAHQTHPNTPGRGPEQNGIPTRNRAAASARSSRKTPKYSRARIAIIHQTRSNQHIHLPIAWSVAPASMVDCIEAVLPVMIILMTTSSSNVRQLVLESWHCLTVHQMLRKFVVDVR